MHKFHVVIVNSAIKFVRAFDIDCYDMSSARAIARVGLKNDEAIWTVLPM